MDAIVRRLHPQPVGLIPSARTRGTRPVPSLMKGITSIEDLRQAARRRVPRAFFGYAEAGSYSEQTLHANRADLESIDSVSGCSSMSRRGTRARQSSVRELRSR